MLATKLPLAACLLLSLLLPALGHAQAPAPPAYPYLIQGRIGRLNAPAFTQFTPYGQAVSLMNYRGKYVLVEFWVSWCRPCRERTPEPAQGLRHLLRAQL
jgi:thiol-disulfide isomerase/thioredoxin